MRKTELICDHCGKRVVGANYQVGHLELLMTGDFTLIGKYQNTGPQDFCSPQCLIDEMIEATK